MKWLIFNINIKIKTAYTLVYIFLIPKFIYNLFKSSTEIMILFSDENQFELLNNLSLWFLIHQWFHLDPEKLSTQWKFFNSIKEM